MPKKYDDIPEYLELTKLLRKTWDYRTANSFLELFAGWQDVLTAKDDDSLLASFYVIEMDQTPNVTGGGTTATVGFQLKDLKGEDKTLSLVLEFAAFDDELATPAANAILSNATAGTIIASSGPALKVKTDSNGKFTCTLTDNVDETVVLGATGGYSTKLFLLKEARSISFSA